MTIKQMKALQNMVENGGNMYRAMIDAGYSHSMAKNSHKLRESVQVRRFLSELGLLPEIIVSDLCRVLKGESTADSLMVAKFCLSSRVSG